METPSPILGGQQGHPQNPREPPALTVLSSWIQRGGSWAPPVSKLPLPLGRPCRAAGQDGAGPPGVQQLWLFLPAPPCRGHMAEPWPPAQQLRLRLMERRGGVTAGTPGSGSGAVGQPPAQRGASGARSPPGSATVPDLLRKEVPFHAQSSAPAALPRATAPSPGTERGCRHRGLVTLGDGDTRPRVTHGCRLVSCRVPMGRPRACRSILAPPAERDGLERLMLPWGCVPKGAIPKAPGGMGTGT